MDEECTDGYGYTHRHHEPSALSPDFCKRCGQPMEELEERMRPKLICRTMSKGAQDFLYAIVSALCVFAEIWQRVAP